MGSRCFTCLARHMHGPYGHTGLLLAKHVLAGFFWR